MKATPCSGRQFLQRVREAVKDTGHVRECIKPDGHDGDCEWGDWMVLERFPFSILRPTSAKPEDT